MDGTVLWIRRFELCIKWWWWWSIVCVWAYSDYTRIIININVKREVCSVYEKSIDREIDMQYIHVISTFYGLCGRAQYDNMIRVFACMYYYIYFTRSHSLCKCMPVVEMSRQLQMNHRHKYDLSDMMCAANTLIWAHFNKCWAKSEIHLMVFRSLCSSKIWNRSVLIPVPANQKQQQQQ